MKVRGDQGVSPARFATCTAKLVESPTVKKVGEYGFCWSGWF